MFLSLIYVIVLIKRYINLIQEEVLIVLGSQFFIVITNKWSEWGWS